MASSNNLQVTGLNVIFTTPIKLDRNNYKLWKSQVLSSIRGNGLESFIEATTENVRYDLWKRQDQLLLSWLLSSMSIEILTLVASSASSFDLWTKLEKQFASESEAKKWKMSESALSRGGQDHQLPDQIKRKLYRAALNDDWAEAKVIYDENEGNFGFAITENDDTALHVAAAVKHIDFVKELVKLLKTKDLTKQNKVGLTALFFVAASGVKELAEVVMMKGNTDIAKIRDDNDWLPIHVAATLGHKDMVEYLYEQTKDSLNNEDCRLLLIKLTETELYDVALHLLNDRPQLATYRKKDDDETALHVLARKNLTSSIANQNQEGLFSSFFKLENKQKQALKLVEFIWEEVLGKSDNEILRLIGKPGLIFDAAKHGNVEFLSILLRGYPGLVWKVDGDNMYTIFHYAVLNRQEDVFKLIHEIGSIKDFIFVSVRDIEGNNILHLAGKLAPLDRLNIVSGAALQMQRELWVFKEVEKVVLPRFAEARNSEDLTPRALFTEKHKGLRVEGEKWMKDTASSCMIVATLIATVVFAAAFTVPGGTKGDTGIPFFLEKVSFKIFIISDAISMVSSSLSIVNFLSILTSRYAEEDFLELLPSKLLCGLATLFISIAAMMVVFSATFFIVFNGGSLWIAIMVTVIASMPVILFIRQHYKLFYDVLRSTYVSNSLFKKAKAVSSANKVKQMNVRRRRSYEIDG